jgi:hypothetical protein
MGLGSGIRPIPDTGSRIRISNTAGYLFLFILDQDTKDIFTHPNNKPPLGLTYTKTTDSLRDELTWRTGGTS